jgi:hypothetical protein
MLVGRPNLLVNLFGKLVLGNFEIARSLKIHPKARTGMEIPAETHSCIGRDAAAFADNFSDASHRNTQIEGKAVHTQAERLEIVLAEDFSGVDRRKFFSASHDLLLVIIDNCDLKRVSTFPNRTDPPLIIDTDAVLP